MAKKKIIKSGDEKIKAEKEDMEKRMKEAAKDDHKS